MTTNEPPLPTIRQRIYFWTITTLIAISWCALVTALAVTMIRLDVPDMSSDPNEPDYFYDTGVWDSPVR